MIQVKSIKTYPPFSNGLSVLRPEKIVCEKPVLKIIEKTPPPISKVEPPSPELTEQLNRIGSQPPFCYIYKAKEFDSR
jgi:hypothetical protein